MHVIAFGSYDTGAHPRAAVLFEGLAGLGIRVTEINAPLQLDTARRVGILRDPHLIHELLFKVLASWGRLVTKAARLRSSGRWKANAVLVPYMGHFDIILARLLFPRTPIALDMLIFAADTARDRGETSRLKLLLLDALDRVALHTANVVILDTEENLRNVPVSLRERVVVAPVGASRAWHRAGESRSDQTPSLRPLRVVFFGMFTPLQGAPVIGTALHHLSQREDIQVTMIGRGQEYDLTRTLAGDCPNVEWVAWVEPGDLPRIVADADVCLGIFGVSDKATSVVPNKVFQGAAAGCVIVTSDTPPQRRSLAENAIFVPPGDAFALAEVLARLAGCRDEVVSYGRRSRELARVQFTPEAIAAPVAEALSPTPVQRRTGDGGESR